MLDVDPVNFLQRSKELSYHPQILSYNAIADSFQNKDVDKTLLNGAILLNWEVNTPEFIKLYQAKYSSLPAKSADKHYDAVYVLAKAISENSDLSKVASYIENNSFTTINGTISFEPTHSVKEIPVHIQAYIDGALVDLK